MKVVTFVWKAKFGHFLRAEANVNAITYPVPPRTAVLGLLGAIIGLEKDSIAHELADALVTVCGAPPKKFWHRVKLRKDPPTALPWIVKKGQKGSSVPEKAALIRQEWLWRPEFRIHVALPEQPDRFSELIDRLQHRRWHYTPCMGLSELLAEVLFESCHIAEPLPSGKYSISGLCPEKAVHLCGGKGIAVHLLRMSHSVTEDRVFEHRGYYIERQGLPIPVETGAACEVGDEVVILS